jgi:hypothetical protein
MARIIASKAARRIQLAALGLVVIASAVSLLEGQAPSATARIAGAAVHAAELRGFAALAVVS